MSDCKVVSVSLCSNHLVRINRLCLNWEDVDVVVRSVTHGSTLAATNLDVADSPKFCESSSRISILFGRQILVVILCAVDNKTLLLRNLDGYGSLNVSHVVT